MRTPEYARRAVKRYQEKNPERRMWANAKQRAAKAELSFTIEIADIRIPEICPYLGVPLTNRLGEGRLPYNPSIDRIDPEKGYHRDNIEVISFLANRMKQNATKEQLITFAYAVLIKFEPPHGTYTRAAQSDPA